jgi:hypothetical protein
MGSASRKPIGRSPNSGWSSSRIAVSRPTRPAPTMIVVADVRELARLQATTRFVTNLPTASKTAARSHSRNAG